jgi:threonine-phosphate decarboxylase
MQTHPSATEMSFRHGGSPDHDFERLKIEPRPVVDFSVNVNPLGPPREIVEAWSGLSRAMASYPTVHGDKVRRFYQERFELPFDCVLPGNGSIELIYLVPRALQLKEVVLLEPCFRDYGRAACLAGARSLTLQLRVDNGCTVASMEELADRLAHGDALFIGNPNNPTGTVFSPRVLLGLAERYPDKWFLVDEAFVQFVEDYEHITLMNRENLRQNLLVFHSLTKFYALPGLRLGAAIGHPATINRLWTFKEPWAINGVAEQAASMLANCRNYEKKTRKTICEERRRLRLRLREISGIRAFNSAANFFLAQWKGTDNLDDLLRTLLSRGLYVRDCRDFPGLENNFFRFAIRSRADNDYLMDAIADCAEDKNG